MTLLLHPGLNGVLLSSFVYYNAVYYIFFKKFKTCLYWCIYFILKVYQKKNKMYKN